MTPSVGPLVRINNNQCSSCTQLQEGNQTKNQTTQMNHHKRSDRGRQSNHFDLMEQNGKKRWASVRFISTKWNNPRTEIQWSQRRKVTEFARNGTREFIRPCSKRMARKCEQAWHSYEKGKSIHVLRYIVFNIVSFPSSLGMGPVSLLSSVQIEWQENVSKRDIHRNKTKQSTYGNRAKSLR
jgi:hypothetical protein